MYFFEKNADEWFVSYVFYDYMTYNASAEEEFIVREVTRVLNEYLQSLSQEDEYMFVCRYYYSDTIADIARMMELNPKTVSKALLRIREGLKARLEKEGYSYEK